MLSLRPKRTKTINYLGVFLLALWKKQQGLHKFEIGRDHFNRVVREAKCMCEDPSNSNGLNPESYYLASRMFGNDELRREIMQINTIDDVDEETANQLLLRLEPTYARPEKAN